MRPAAVELLKAHQLDAWRWANCMCSACRLFEELWVPLVNDSFAKGATIYMHLTGPVGKHLLHAAH